MTIRVPALKTGDSIGVIAPAGPVTPSELHAGIALLEATGFRVILSPDLYAQRDYLAGDDETRLREFHAMFENREIKAVICARGGYGTLRLLHGIDFELIRKNPKIFVGYSDITALHWAIYAKTRMVTIHGPMIKGLAENGRGNLDILLDLVSSDRPFQYDFSGKTIVREGRARGVILGGNLCMICHLIGTPFMPSLKGAVLFLEDRGEPLYRIDRMLTQLRLSGLLEGLAGVIAGDFLDCGDPHAIYRLLDETLFDYDIPILGGLPLGHGVENLSLPLGVEALLDTHSMSLSITETGISS